MKNRGHWNFRLGALAALAACLSVGAVARDQTEGELVATQGAPGVPACASCHGAKGEGQAEAGFPRLGGTGASYLEEQLYEFSTGTRKSPVMEPFAAALSPRQRVAVATYFSLQPAAEFAVPAVSSAITPKDTGAWLATRGRWNDGVPACVQCHGSQASGVGPTFPPLAGLSSAYIAQQLHHWKDGARPAGPLGLMSTIAAKLSESDMTAVADYFAGMRPLASVAAPSKEAK